MKLRLSRKASREFTGTQSNRRSETPSINDARSGLTVFEVLVTVGVLVGLAVLFLPLLANRSHGGQKISCYVNLKQVGLAFRIWEGDNNDKYPMQVSTTNGGAMELVSLGYPIPVFQVMSNELSTPKILFCPQDENRYMATNFTSSLTSNTVSYFVNPDAIEANPQDVMCGDDNLQINGVRAKPGLLTLSPDIPVTWSSARHKYSGNLTMADGSVQSYSNRGLQKYLFPTNSTSLRLALP